MQTIPTRSEATTIGAFPPNAVEMPYMMPMSPTLTSTTEGASAFGCVNALKFLMIATVHAKATAVITANTANSICQPATLSSTPPAMGPKAGPSSVTALTMPMYVPSLPCGATSSVRFIPIGTTIPVPSAWTMRAASSMGKFTAANPISVPASSKTRAAMFNGRVGISRYRKPVTGTVTAATSM